jgi:chromosome segregation ATPase
MTLPENLRKRIAALYHWPGWHPIGAIGDALSGVTGIGLVVIALYTVIPLYQNAMLEEKNARLERELDDKKKSLAETVENLEDTRNQVNLTENNLLQAKTDLADTRRENQDLQKYNSELIKGINTQRLEQKDLTRIIDDLYHERRDLKSEIVQLKAEKEKRDEAIVRYEIQTKEYVISQFIQKVKGKLAPTPNDNILALEMQWKRSKLYWQD